MTAFHLVSSHGVPLTPPFPYQCTDMAAEMSLLEMYVGVVLEFFGIRILEGQTLVTNVTN